MDQPNKRFSDSVNNSLLPSPESRESTRRPQVVQLPQIPNRKHYLVLSKERVAQVHRRGAISDASASSTQARSR